MSIYYKVVLTDMQIKKFATRKLENMKCKGANNRIINIKGKCTDSWF